VAPEHEAVGRELLSRIAKQQLAGWSIEEGVSISEGYWDVVLRRRDTLVYEVFEWMPDRSAQVPGIETTAKYFLAQEEVCREAGAEFAPPLPKQMIAVSSGVFEGRRPVEGIRYQAPPHMSGWYLTTDEYDGNVDSLRVDHTYHLTAARAELSRLLALPPGYWFILRDDSEDIGFDAEAASEGL
jgi:hypothetical protein